MVLSSLLACVTASPRTSLDASPSAPTSTATPGPSTFTVAVWMAADNDLESLAVGDLDELEEAAGPRVAIEVQLDRIPGYATAQGDWSGTRRIEIVHDEERGPVSPVVEELGEVDMGDGEALADFLTWADARRPSDHFVVILWNHGGGYWIASDDTDHDKIHIEDGELSAALQAVVDQRGRKIDVVGFDACNMGEWEVAHALRDQASVMTASSAWVGSEGYSYGDAFADLPEDADGRWVGERLVWSAGVLGGELTQAAIDLDRVGELSGALDALAGAWLDRGALDEFAGARDAAQGLDQQWEDFWLDVGSLADASADADPALADARDRVRTALDEVVYARYTQPELAFASGLTLFADTSRADWLDLYREGPWSDATRWNELLEAAAAR